MQDAEAACRNSVKKHFPECKVLMCYFHLLYNVRTNKYKYAIQDHLTNVKSDIKELHFSKSNLEFTKLLKKIYIKFRIRPIQIFF